MLACVFCRFLAGAESEWNRRADVVLETAEVTAFVSPRTWTGNEGNAIVVPNAHVQDLESASNDVIAAVFAVAAQVARAMRAAYGCEGTSLRQHSGAAAGQGSRTSMCTSSRARPTTPCTGAAPSTASRRPRSGPATPRNCARTSASRSHFRHPSRGRVRARSLCVSGSGAGEITLL